MLFHRMMPEPIHAVAALAIPVEIVYPRKRSADAENEKVIKRRLLNLRLQLGLEEENQEVDDENIDDTVQNESDIQDMDSIVSSTTHASINHSRMNDVPDVSSGMTLPVCDHVISWLSKLETNRDVLGTAHSAAVKTMTGKVKEIAKPNTNKEYQKRQLRRMKVLQVLSEKFKDRRGMINLYCEVVKEKIDRRLKELQDIDGKFNHPIIEDDE